MVMMRTLRAQAAALLREQIDADYQPGDRLPAEALLATQMGVSRNTIREAIADLVADGRLETKWGVGTTVRPARQSPRTPAVRLDAGGSLDRAAPESDTRLSLVRFVVDRREPPHDVAETLGMAAGDRVVFIERLYTLAEVPAVLLQDWYRTRIDAMQLDFGPLRDITIHLPDLIHRQTGKALGRVEGRLEAIMSSGDFLTGSRAPHPIVQIAQSVFSDDGETVTYSLIQYDTTVVDLSLQHGFRL